MTQDLSRYGLDPRIGTSNFSSAEDGLFTFTAIEGRSFEPNPAELPETFCELIIEVTSHAARRFTKAMNIDLAQQIPQAGNISFSGAEKISAKWHIDIDPEDQKLYLSLEAAGTSPVAMVLAGLFHSGAISQNDIYAIYNELKITRQTSRLEAAEYGRSDDAQDLAHAQQERETSTNADDLINNMDILFGQQLAINAERFGTQTHEL